MRQLRPAGVEGWPSDHVTTDVEAVTVSVERSLTTDSKEYTKMATVARSTLLTSWSPVVPDGQHQDVCRLLRD